jgi:putative oxidoreductase
MTSQSVRWGVTILRASVASVFVVHGVARLALGTVGGFGSFLGSCGIPGGTALAWTITVVEVGGGLALALGLFVRPLALWFGVEILAGIVLVHAQAGWFVVGAGRGGAEYSALIIACLVSVALADPVAHRLGRASGWPSGVAE